MSETIQIKAKSKTGNIIDIQVSEILEIDGKPYQAVGELDQLKALVNHLSGRLAAIENILGKGE